MPSRRRRHLLAWAAIVGALALAWTLGGYLVAPRLLHGLAVDLVRERMHRELQLGDIQVDPLRLAVTVGELRLPDVDGSPMLAWRQARAELALLRSLALRAPVLASVQVDGVKVEATRSAEGRLNLAALALLKGPDDGDRSPARFLVEQLAVQGDSIRFTQRGPRSASVLQVDRLRLEATRLGTVGAPADEVRLALHTAADETLEARGHLHPAPFTVDAAIELKSLRTATLLPYLADTLPVDVKGGRIDLRGQIAIAAGEGPLQLKALLATLQLNDVGLHARGASDELLHLRRVTATDGRVDLAAREAGIAKLEVDGLSAKVWRDAKGALNLAALAAAGAPSPDTPASASSAWRWQLPEFRLTKGELALEDRGVKPAARLALHDVAFTLRGLSQDLSQPLGTELVLRVGDAGRLSSRGEFRADTRAFEGRADASGIDLRAAQSYVQQSADLTLLSGRLGFSLDVQASPQRTHVRGEADVRDLRTVDNVLKQDFALWKLLRARNIDYDTAPRPRLRIREVIANAPYARVVVGADRSLNLSHVLRQADVDVGNTDDEATPAQDSAPVTDSQPVAAATPPPAMDLAIDVLRIENASANFADLWIEPHFAVGIQDLGGTIKGLSSQEGSRATVDLKGAVDRYAPVVISGEINPLSAALFSDLSMSFRNMDLTSVTPYSGRFAGYEIQKGKLSVDLEYHIKARRLDAKHHLVVDQLELGEPVASPDATSLPVRLAIALLKDRHGVIDVQLPVSGSLDDPKFRIAPLVWKMVVNLVVKAVTAPFALLGSLFGGGEDLNQVTFIPGTAQLDEPGRQRVEALRKAMVERPGLRLDLPAAWSAEVDRPALVRRQLEAQLAELAPQAGPDRHARLVAAWREEAGKAPLPGKTDADLEAALLARYVVEDQELEDLGRRRALAIQEVLFATQEIDPVRVFVVDGKPAAADAQALRIDLLLK